MPDTSSCVSKFQHKLFALALAFALSACFFAPGNAFSASKECSQKGFRLYGRVQVVSSFPDLRVQKVTSFQDMDVQLVQSSPNSCGKWQIVDSAPDLKIQYVDSFPDIKVRIVNNFPGMR